MSEKMNDAAECNPLDRKLHSNSVLKQCGVEKEPKNTTVRKPSEDKALQNTDLVHKVRISLVDDSEKLFTTLLFNYNFGFAFFE